MSSFYQSMDLNKKQNLQFKAIKREFKRGQACAHCGRKDELKRMTVDHIIPVDNPAIDPFDMFNWQVLCMSCHRNKTNKYNRRLKGVVKQNEQ